MTPTPLAPPHPDRRSHTPERPAEHYTQLWPTTAGRPADAPLFLALMSPVRTLALAVLWATSSPGRLLIGVTAAIALVAVVLIAL